MIAYEGVIPVERGCGRRVEDGIYWELGFGPAGRGVEDFILDPPLLVPPNLLASIGHVGVQMFERNGVWHILDRVGLHFYPNAADLIEEVRRFGLSRRLPNNLPFARLTPESRIILIHDRGVVENFDLFRSTNPDWGGAWMCPRHLDAHHPDCYPHYCCAGMWWECIEGGEEIEGAERAVQRTMPSFAYIGFKAPAGVEPWFAPAFIASFPASRLVVVKGHRSLQMLGRISQSSLPISEVDE